MSFFGPTVICHIKDDPFLLCRSYLSLYKDAAGKRVTVHDGMISPSRVQNPSQAKRRHKARQQNRFASCGR